MCLIFWNALASPSLWVWMAEGPSQMGVWRTYANGEGGEVDEPKEEQAALEAHAVEDQDGKYEGC